MRKSKKHKKIKSWDSYTDEDGKRLMICANSEIGGETFKGRYWKGVQCRNYTPVANYTEAVVCWRCSEKLVDPPIIKSAVKKSDKARGWHFMKEYVDKNGNVFYKGIEQPDLKGTLKPTVIKEKPKKKKLSKVAKANLRTESLIKYNSLTKLLIKTTKKTERAKLARQISKLQRQLKKL